MTPPRPQRGVVLVIALIMLAVISLLAAVSVRNSTSTEAVAGNLRLAKLATQAAESALRFCEQATVQFVGGQPALTPVPTVLDFSSPSQGLRTATLVWDVTPTVAFVLPLEAINTADAPVYRRPPECIVERLHPSTSARYTSAFIVTARGFGPDVAPSNAAHARPAGSEVFLQSIIEFD